MPATSSRPSTAGIAATTVITPAGTTAGGTDPASTILTGGGTGRTSTVITGGHMPAITITGDAGDAPRLMILS